MRSSEDSDMKPGDIVYLPCRVVGSSKMAFSNEPVVDLVPVGYQSQPGVDNSYAIQPFTVFAEDVIARHLTGSL